ncbi:MAG: hypothetical protein APF76_01355 [Desulfitibacter sp. BRH_c19]|nr:MAG: hypothetical protein APF76_01355 [Desulfitibacter sp. BRH_c19]
MKISIEPAAMEYIKKNGGAVYLAYRTAGGGCCGGKGILIPDIFLGIPKGEPSHYEIKCIFDISVYYSNDIKALKELRINLESFLGLKKLSIIGIE